MTNKEIIGIMQQTFPKFTKMQLSMIHNKDKYGVDFSADAKKLLRETTGKKKESKRETKRIRIDTSVYSVLEECAKIRNCKSVSDFINTMFGEGNDETDTH